jgi:hypothetical protein
MSREARDTSRATIDPGWPSRASPPPLVAGEVHLWRLWLDAAPTSLPRAGASHPIMRRRFAPLARELPNHS